MNEGIRKNADPFSVLGKSQMRTSGTQRYLIRERAYIRVYRRERGRKTFFEKKVLHSKKL